ncbi:glycosyltransferase [Fictibacillus arsenicus]|uniref:glycosyltransferase n=1 Tax=Fictibacillus arsenicus TaxID=255247 RepID=UPI0026D31EC9|nr:glycosyltransferase [Fictibacillus arsenicus]
MFSQKNRDGSIREKYKITEKYIFLFVGRLAPEKDLDILYEIIKKLPPPLNECVHWLIVGDGPNRHEVNEWEKKHRNITCAGYLSGNELAQAYASSDLFVFPSSTETFGNVVLEAHASGVPAVVSDTGGVVEIVEDHVTGMICKARNADSFTKTIAAILENPATLDMMGWKARNYALTQSWSTIFGNLLLQYEEAAFKKANKKTIIS